jgi:hypothetical protein
VKKRDPTIPVYQPTLKQAKPLGNGDGVIFSLDRRTILNIVNRKAKKPPRPARRSPQK